jgi:hypothetical protein
MNRETTCRYAIQYVRPFGESDFEWRFLGFGNSARLFPDLNRAMDAIEKCRAQLADCLSIEIVEWKNGAPGRTVVKLILEEPRHFFSEHKNRKMAQ